MSFGGGKGTTSVESPAATTLANLAESFAGETTGIRTGLIDAMQEVLQTGGSSIPIISRAVESTRQAGSDALKGINEQLALSGLAGTPEGESIRSKTMQQGEIAAGQTEQSLANAIFQMIPNLVLGQAQAATQGLAGAIPGMQKGRETAFALGK